MMRLAQNFETVGGGGGGGGGVPARCSITMWIVLMKLYRNDQNNRRFLTVTKRILFPGVGALSSLAVNT